MMNHSIAIYNNIKFLILEIEEISQKGHSFHIAKAPAKEVVNMFTVSPAEYDISKYSELAKMFEDEKDYYDAIVETKKKQTDFQRDKDPGRVKSINDYIKLNEYAFFPNTIICTVECVEIPEDEKTEHFISNWAENHSPTTSYLTQGENCNKLLIPIREKAILVIDGQHRLEGLKAYFEEEPQNEANYDLIISFFIGFDRTVVAQQFYTINHEQKPVNKSILYHLMGEFSDGLNDLTILHNFTRLLNEYSKSPFFQRIKMLGKTPKGANRKELYSISQAFIIDELIKTVSMKSLNSMYQPCFAYYLRDEDKQVDVVKFLIRYFSAIKSLRTDWDEPWRSIISKGIGVAALTKVLQLLIPILYCKGYFKEPDGLIKIETDTLIKLLSGIENVDLFEFSGQGSAGSITKIKIAFVEGIEFFKCTDYHEFEREFKDKYLPIFKDYNKKLVDIY